MISGGLGPVLTLCPPLPLGETWRRHSLRANKRTFWVSQEEKGSASSLERCWGGGRRGAEEPWDGRVLGVPGLVVGALK